MEKENNKKMDIKVKLSMLWVVVMFNMVFADILSFITPGVMAGIMTGYADGVKLTQELLLIFAILTEIPIIMIFLSRVLEYKINRWANIISGVITILWIVGGGSAHLHYIFFCSVEVICLIFIIWNSWKWDNSNLNSAS